MQKTNYGAYQMYIVHAHQIQFLPQASDSGSSTK